MYKAGDKVNVTIDGVQKEIVILPKEEPPQTRPQWRLPLLPGDHPVQMLGVQVQGATPLQARTPAGTGGRLLPAKPGEPEAPTQGRTTQDSSMASRGAF